MKRRQFISAMVPAAAALSLPSFLSDAFAKEPYCGAKDKNDRRKKQAVLGEMAAVANAFRTASKNRKPLLVFVVPKDERLQYDRGLAYGELLNYGSDADLAPLADVEVVCAPMRALRRIVPGVAEGEPLMVLIRADALPATSRHLNADLKNVSTALRNHTEQHELDKVIEERISTLARLIREGVGDNKHRIAARAALARERFKVKAPAGTQWAKSYGCGILFEGEEDNARVGCGMAFVPAKSSRFLYFYSSEQP